jgi:predicted permease
LVRLKPVADRGRVEAHASQVFNVVKRIDRPAGLDKDSRILFGPLPPGQAPASSTRTQVLLAVAAVAGLVLLMACGNVANLLILTGLRRTAELTLKAALGAGRGRLLREVFLQALVLAALAGGAAFLLVVTVGTVVRRAFLPPVAATVAAMDGRLALLTVGVCAAVALILGVAPALRLTSLGMLVPGRSRISHPSRLLDSFVAIQVALSVPLLVGTALFAISFWSITHVDIGWEPTRVVTLKANLLDDGRPADAHEAHRRIQARVASLPGVVSTALAQSTPLQGGLGTIFEIPGYQPRTGGYSMPMINGVDPAFQDVMRLRILQGRAFTDADNRRGAEPVALINEAMASFFWPDMSPVGRCIKVARRDCVRVIGVVAKASPFGVLRGIPGPMTMQYFVPMETFHDLNADRVLLVRTSEPPRRLLGRLRAEAQAAAPDLPYVDAAPLDEALESQIAPLRLGWSIFLGLSGLALVIAIAGLTVVTAHGVTRRTREMGIRLVLGAKPGDLVRLMARRTLVAMTIGLAVGATLAYLGAGFLKSVLFGIEPGDPRVFAAALVALFAVGGLAAWIPARRTGRIDPSAALRME